MLVESLLAARKPQRDNRMGLPAGSAGFTLLELLVVLVILGLLAAVAVPQVMNYLGRAQSDAAKTQIRALETAVDLYRLDVGRYPSSLESLVARPADAERWNGPYVKKRESLVDPWGEPYVYRFPGQHGTYDMYSLGADKAEGGEGENRDLTNW